MASNAEGIGALIATSTLMKGERQLLRKPDADVTGESEKAAVQQPGAAIANDSKNVASLLLTLLDDRLAEAGRSIAPGSERAAAQQAQDTSRRVAAAYVDEGAAVDFNRPEAVAAPTVQGPLPNTSPVAAPELQTFLQRLAAFATGRVEANQATRPGDGRRLSPTGGEGAAIYRTAGVILVGWWLGMLLVQWLFK